MFELIGPVLACAGMLHSVPDNGAAICVQAYDKGGPYETEELCQDQVDRLIVASAMAMSIAIGGGPVTTFTKGCEPVGEAV